MLKNIRGKIGQNISLFTKKLSLDLCALGVRGVRNQLHGSPTVTPKVHPLSFQTFIVLINTSKMVGECAAQRVLEHNRIPVPFS